MAKYKRRIKTIGGQKETWPIKDVKQLDSFLSFYAIQRDKAKTPIKRYQADRNWMLCMVGVNTAHRAEDLLQLRVSDLENGYVCITENKTGKHQNYRMSKELYKEILEYIDRNHLTSNEYMFLGQKNSQFPITRQQSHNVVMRAARAVGIGFPFGLHGLRKTFGYQYILHGGNPLTLMKMYNHDDVSTTLLYVMWNNDDAQADRHSVYFAGKKCIVKGKKFID